MSLTGTTGLGRTTLISLFGIEVRGDPDAPRGVLGPEKLAGAPRPPEPGIEYLAADESAAVAERDPFPTDPDVIERGTRSHARLQNQLAAEVADAGLVPLSPAAGDPRFDLAWRDWVDLHVAEVKSTTATNEEHQLRLGLGQLLRYRLALSIDGSAVRATLFVEQKPADPHPASERGRVLAQFRTQQERQGFSPEIADCLAGAAGRLPLDALRRGRPSNDWYLVVLTTSPCGPPAVRGFILSGLEREFRARPRAFPTAYRRCIVAGVRRLPPGRVSQLIVGAVAGRHVLTTELRRIGAKCQASAR
jgi:hypothetical protein